MNVISTNRLTRRYGSHVAVNQVELEVGEGEIFGFLGPNGAGKSTTIRMLLGFLKPSGGGATVLGRDCWEESTSIKRNVGYLAGDLRLYPWLSCNAALSIVSRIRNVDLRPEGVELAERFGLDQRRRVRTMSRGTRQKLGLVLALASRPRVLVLDEPTSGLDPLMQLALADRLRQAAADGCTIFFSSHTLSEVESLCQRVAIVRNGRIVADETINALRSRAARRVEIVFESESDAAAPTPDFLHNVKREGRTLGAEINGSATPVVEWAAKLATRDVSISRPDLESLFRRYYENDAGEAG